MAKLPLLGDGCQVGPSPLLYGVHSVVRSLTRTTRSELRPLSRGAAPQRLLLEGMGFYPGCLLMMMMTCRWHQDPVRPLAALVLPLPQDRSRWPGSGSPPCPGSSCHCRSQRCAHACPCGGTCRDGKVAAWTHQATTAAVASLLQGTAAR